MAQNPESKPVVETYPAKLGVLAIMKNEALNLNEWLDHYFWIGAERIYLIDNGSTDGSFDIAAAHRNSQSIRLVELAEPHAQVAHYRTAYDYFEIAAECEWLLIADLDEFWFCKDGRKLPNLFHMYEGHDLIYVNWSVFASNKSETHPKSLRRELILKRPTMGGNLSTKWLCRTNALVQSEQIYTHKVHNIDSSRTISDNVHLQLNHYVTQSKYFFRTVKMTRGDASQSKNDNIRDWQYFEKYDKNCNLYDTVLKDLLS